MNRIYRLIIPLISMSFSSYCQHIATIKVDMSRSAANLDVPVHVALDAITQLPATTVRLLEVKGSRKVPVPFQIENREQRFLYWVIRPQKEETKTRVFELIKGMPLTQDDHIKIVEANGSLTIGIKDRNLLRYNYKTMYPPKGVDTVFKRSGFIHPLWSPKGQELTRVNAPDHYHHFGLWNPWTKVLFEEDTIDFWNLGEKQGTVRFAKFVSLSEGAVYADFQALHEHVAFTKGGKEKVVLNELQTVRIYQPEDNPDYYIADITIRLNNPNKSAVVLKEYRYGGLGWRATGEWNKDNSETLTSENKTRKNADGTKARWVIVQGSIGKEYAGAVMMSYPGNYNYPEPLRIWPEDMNGRGDVYANFSPTNDKDWVLDKGQDYLLKYRFLVFNGHLTKEKAESAWQYFADSPKITVKLNPIKSN